MTKVFYSLNYQDLPEFFEDNMKTWMDGFHTLLIAPSIACLDSEVGEKCVSQLFRMASNN